MKKLCFISLLALTLAGCGQSGALYLPSADTTPSKNTGPSSISH
ncbi:MAG: lipoprotein [Gammaproteobacteria bacterium]|nr:lipoprotein [Gammaproteobacteria bacterium]